LRKKNGTTLIKEVDQTPLNINIEAEEKQNPLEVIATNNKDEVLAVNSKDKNDSDEEETQSKDEDTPKTEKPYYSSVIFKHDAVKPIIEWSTNLESDIKK